MASRFVGADNDVIEELKTSENLNARKSTNLLVGVFKKLAGRAALRNIGEKAKTWKHTRFSGFYKKPKTENRPEKPEKTE
jgi:hypothetical protein